MLSVIVEVNKINELSNLEYVIGSYVQARSGDICDFGQKTLYLISTRTITDLAFIAQNAMKIPLSLDLVKMPWGVEASNIYDKLSILSHSGILKEGDGENEWYFFGDMEAAKIGMSEDVLERVALMQEIYFPCDEATIRKYIGYAYEDK